WGEEITKNLQEKSDFYIQPCIKDIVDSMDLSNKKVAQFCCNNGRELLSISKHYHVEAIGFDIAENLLEQGKRHADELQLPCEFVAANILDINDSYANTFDVILFTIGAITWFEDLHVLFEVASKCLKPGGIMILHDFHPVMNMLPLPGEQSYNTESTILLEDKYFTKEPWIENSGMGYISGEFPSKTFISFSHSISKIINAIISSNMNILQFEEFDYDVGLSDVYDHKGFPLSMLLVANKID
ncbi:MAG: class I SAM-dependent methyltransferase, partial [Longicatena sp.]